MNTDNTELLVALMDAGLTPVEARMLLNTEVK